MREAGHLQPGDMCVCCSRRAALGYTAPPWPVPPKATCQRPPGEPLRTGQHCLPSRHTRAAPGTAQPGTGVRGLLRPPTRGVTGDRGNRVWPQGRRRSPVAHVRLRGAARGAAGSRPVRTLTLGPERGSLRLWGDWRPRMQKPRIPRCVTWGSSKHMSTAPPMPLRSPGTPTYLAHFRTHRSPGNLSPGNRRWQRPGSWKVRSPWPSRGPRAAAGGAGRWTRTGRRCLGHLLAPCTWGDREGTSSQVSTQSGAGGGDGGSSDRWPLLHGPWAQTLGFPEPSPLLRGGKDEV